MAFIVSCLFQKFWVILYRGCLKCQQILKNLFSLSDGNPDCAHRSNRWAFTHHVPYIRYPCLKSLIEYVLLVFGKSHNQKQLVSRNFNSSWNTQPNTFQCRIWITNCTAWIELIPFAFRVEHLAKSFISLTPTLFFKFFLTYSHVCSFHGACWHRDREEFSPLFVWWWQRSDDTRLVTENVATVLSRATRAKNRNDFHPTWPPNLRTMY